MKPKEEIDRRTLEQEANLKFFKISFSRKTKQPIISVKSTRSDGMAWERNFTIEDLKSSIDRAERIIKILQEEIE